MSKNITFKPDLEGFLSPGFRLIEAGAGSGKTFNLELLVLRLVAERAKRVGEIVLVTYTEAAAMEMRQRVRARLKSIADGSAMERLVAAEKNGTITETGQSELASLRSILAVGQGDAETQRIQRVRDAVDELYRLRITTIHGFCQHVLSEHGPNHGFPPLASAPVAPDELIQEIAQDWFRSQSAKWPLSECVLAVRALLADPSCDVRLLFRNIGIPADMSEAKGNSAKARALKKEILERAGQVFSSEAPGLQKKLLEFVSARRALRNTVTFDDLILKLREALSEKSERSAALTDSVRRSFTCCLIDEFQDTDDTQWSIFSHFFVPRAEDPGSREMLLVAVGDPKQAIYGFRGADIRTYIEARRDVTDGVVHTLDNNFRTDPVVIKAFNQLFSLPGYFADNELGYNNALPAPGKKDVLPTPPLRIVPSIDATQIPKEVARLLNDLDKAKVSEGTVGVLVRGNQEADDLHRQLVKSGLPAALESTQSVFSTQAAYVALLLLRAVLHHEDVRARRALIYARPALFGDLAAKLACENAEAGLQAVDTQLAAWIAKAHAIWTKHGFTSCWSHLTRVAPSGLCTVQESLARALFRSRLLVDLSHVGELLAARQRERLWDPHQVVTHLEAKISGASADMDTDAQMDESLRPESARPRVVVQTIHKSKGLEYGAVLIYLKQAGQSKGIAGTILKTGNGKTRQLLLGPKDELKKSYPELVDDVELQVLQENARLLYVAITRAKHRLVVMTREDAKKKEGNIGLHEVLENAGLDAFSWKLVASGKTPEAEESIVWDDSLVGQDDLSTDEYESEPPPGLAYDERADGLNKINTALGSTNFTAITKHQEFPKEYLPGQEDNAGGSQSHVFQDDSKEDVLLGSGAKGALFGVFIHELLDGLDFKSAANGMTRDGRSLVEYVRERLLVSGIPAPRDDSDYSLMAAQTAKACQLWLSAKLPPLGDAGAAGFCLKDIDESKILSEIRFALRSSLGAESVEGIKALFKKEFTAHYPRVGKGPSPLAGVSMAKKTVEGVLTGVADLIFMHEGRFYIVDWKTNFLGNQVSDYDRATVDLEMAESFYHLQYSLYAAALDGFLRQSLGSGWSYDPPSKPGSAKTASFGGVYYLFLRAFGHEGRGAIGCHHYRPTREFIESLRLQLANPKNLSPQNEPISK
jgi:exodeoxyribonuclease V beta subunit